MRFSNAALQQVRLSWRGLSRTTTWGSTSKSALTLPTAPSPGRSPTMKFRRTECLTKFCQMSPAVLLPITTIKRFPSITEYLSPMLSHPHPLCRRCPKNLAAEKESFDRTRKFTARLLPQGLVWFEIRNNRSNIPKNGSEVTNQIFVLLRPLFSKPVVDFHMWANL